MLPAFPPVRFFHLLLCVSPSSEHSQPFPLWACISFVRVGGFRAEWSSACVPQATLATGASPQPFPRASQAVNPLHPEEWPSGRGLSVIQAGGRLGPRRPPWCVERACAGPVRFTRNVVILINLFLITEVINVNHLNNWR